MKTVNQKSTEGKCSCGFDISSPYIEIKNKYNFWGWLALMTGITAKPVSADYKCSRCNEVIGSTTDPQVLTRYIN